MIVCYCRGFFGELFYLEGEKMNVENLLAQARIAINRREQFVYDVAGESGQMVDNVGHMQWFVKAVADRQREKMVTYTTFRLRGNTK